MAKIIKIIIEDNCNSCPFCSYKDWAGYKIEQDEIIEIKARYVCELSNNKTITNYEEELAFNKGTLKINPFIIPSWCELPDTEKFDYICKLILAIKIRQRSLI